MIFENVTVTSDRLDGAEITCGTVKVDREVKLWVFGLSEMYYKQKKDGTVLHRYSSMDRNALLVEWFKWFHIDWKSMSFERAEKLSDVQVEAINTLTLVIVAALQGRTV